MRGRPCLCGALLQFHAVASVVEYAGDASSGVTLRSTRLHFGTEATDHGGCKGVVVKRFTLPVRAIRVPHGILRKGFQCTWLCVEVWGCVWTRVSVCASWVCVCAA